MCIPWYHIFYSPLQSDIKYVQVYDKGTAPHLRNFHRVIVHNHVDVVVDIHLSGVRVILAHRETLRVVRFRSTRLMTPNKKYRVWGGGGGGEVGREEGKREGEEEQERVRYGTVWTEGRVTPINRIKTKYQKTVATHV